MKRKKKALDILEIDTEIEGHHTNFTFKKALLDEYFVWEIKIEIDSMPSRLKLYYNVVLALDPAPYNQSLSHQYDLLKKNQLSLLDSENEYLEKMKKIHVEYKKEREMMWDYEFEGRLSEIKNKNTESLNLIVSGEVVRQIEKLKHNNCLHRMILILKTA